MEESVKTDFLRISAQDWNLDGDRKLFELLQNIHQKITSKCEETTRKLNEMCTDLNNASVSLKNVNNRFSSLSNSQFVESRVYDDDADIHCDEPQAKVQEEKPPQPVKDRLTALTASVMTIESMHESVTIVDDSDSEDFDCEEPASVVLKPTDMYADRPLPHVIGSQAWRSKWHVGLLPEDSDSESTASKQEEEGGEEDEDSAETEFDTPLQRDIRTERHVSVSSYNTVTEQPVPEDRIYSPPMTKVYSMFSNPNTAAPLFTSEPPPLDNQSESDEYEEDENPEDIFAEIKNTNAKPTNENKPYSEGDKIESKTVTNDLFEELRGRFPKDGGDKPNPPAPVKATQKPTLSSETEKSVPSGAATIKEDELHTTKKPVGATSLFGTKAGAESIGAAILKRNQRKSSSSSENSESTSEKPKIAPKTVKPVDNKVESPVTADVNVPALEDSEEENESTEKNIFDELFAKSAKMTKKSANKPQDIKRDVIKKDAQKVDIFSDIFDDIDDIFTSNVKKDKPQKKVSIFDDEDDLFADIGFSKVGDKKVSKKIADDELFNETPPELKQTVVKNTVNPEKTAEVVKHDTTNTYNKETKATSLFDSDDENEGNVTTVNVQVKPEVKRKPELDNKLKNKSLFDSDDGDDDIFSVKPKVSNQVKDTMVHVKKPQGIDASGMMSNAQTSKSKDEKESISKDDKSETTLLSKDNVTKSATIAEDNNLKIKSNKADIASKTDIFGDNDEDIFAVEPPPIKKKPERDLTLDISKKTESSRTKHPIPPLFTDSEDDADIFRTEPPPMEQINKTVINESQLNKEDAEPTEANSKGDIFVTSTDKIIEAKTSKTEDIPSNKKVLEKIVVPSHGDNTVAFNSPNVFDDDEFEDKIIADDIQYKENDETDNNYKNEAIFDHPPPDLPTIKGFDKPLESNDMNKVLNVHQTDIFDDLSPETVESKKRNINALFEDSVPPVLEKSKEVKGQNVNALFGDDSDDENLFLRKEDIESYEENVTPNKDKLFSLFRDEPPEFDTDMTPETDVFAAKITKEHIKSDDDSLDGSSLSTESSQSKTIGKLKPLNFNINVNTLLPGAVPKKIEPKVNETKNISEESPIKEPKLVKSVSFESDPDSVVLDNKISKERARIQVKRRPSSRRARKEAVRISAIDFGEDSTDNSNSIDDLPKTINNDQRVIDKTVINDQTESEELPKDDTKILNINDEDIYIYKEPKSVDDKLNVNTKSEDLKQMEGEEKKLVDSDDELFNILPKNDKAVENTEIINEANTQEEISENIDESTVIKEIDNWKDKILDGQKEKSQSDSDEDMFNTLTKTHKPKDIKKLFPDDDETKQIDSNKELFKSETNAGTKQHKKNKKRESNVQKSLFGDSSDEELFGGNKKGAIKKTSIFAATDSDEELFGTQKKEAVPKTTITRKNLFSDDEDDEDLFAGKSNVKVTKSQQPSSSKPTKPAEPTFDDPLSMFND